MTIEPTSTILIIPLSNLNFLDNETQRFSCYYTENLIVDHIGCHVWKVSRASTLKTPIEGTIKKGQFRETGNIRYKGRRKTRLEKI
jgi:hypothetical protein